MDDENEQNEKADLSPSVQEQALEQRIIPFMGDELAAALTANGGIFISLPGMCNALGLNTRGQLQRIQRTKELSLGLRLIPLQTRGGRQPINCIRVDKLGLWLAGIETSRVKSQFRSKLEAYHEKLAPVAIQVFLSMAGISSTQTVPTTDPQIAALAEQIETLTSIVTFLQEHMQSLLEASGQITGISLRLDQAVHLLETLVTRQDQTEEKLLRIDERTSGLTPSHKREVQTLVDHMVRVTKQRIPPLTYSTIYGRLKHRFKVGSYSEIADERFNDVVTFLHEELRKATSGSLPEQGNLF